MRKVGSLALVVSPLLTAAAAVGCAGSGQDTAIVDQIQPPNAYSDVPFAIALLGNGLRPPLAVDTHSGSADVTANAFDITLEPVAPADGRISANAFRIVWINASEIDARLAAGLLPGDYRVAVRDVRGQPIESHALFTSLGPDNDAPHVTIVQPPPGAIVGPGSQIQVVAHVDDGPAPITSATWTATSTSLGTQTGGCDIDPVDETCRFTVCAPNSSSAVEPVDIRIDARDEVGRPATADVEIQVVWSPGVSTVMPDAGSTRGGTTIVVGGTGLVPGVSRILIDDQPIGGTVDGDNISGVTRPHPSGQARISVSNGYGASQPLDFLFVAPPILRLVNPTHAPSGPDVSIDVAGNDFTANTRFSFEQDGAIWPIPARSGAGASLPPPYALYDSPGRYTLHLGPGSGTITLYAQDDIGGDSPPLVDVFTYDPPPTP